MVVLGQTGRNFAAGMSGGVAYVLDETSDFTDLRCNKDMVELEAVSGTDALQLRTLIEQHLQVTNSALAEKILSQWDVYLPQFVKVMPTDYKLALLRLAKEQQAARAKQLDSVLQD